MPKGAPIDLLPSLKIRSSLSHHAAIKRQWHVKHFKELYPKQPQETCNMAQRRLQENQTHSSKRSTLLEEILHQLGYTKISKQKNVNDELKETTNLNSLDRFLTHQLLGIMLDVWFFCLPPFFIKDSPICGTCYVKNHYHVMISLVSCRINGTGIVPYIYLKERQNFP